MSRTGVEAEGGYILAVVGYASALAASEVEVVENVGWIDMVFGTIVEVAVLRISRVAQRYKHGAHSHTAP